VYRGEIGYGQQEIRRYRESLVSAALVCDGEFRRPVKTRIRELLALGAASYGLAAGATEPVSFSSETAVDFAVCSVWPVATLPELPSAWHPLRTPAGRRSEAGGAVGAGPRPPEA
jgi:hypothetical protein